MKAFFDARQRLHIPRFFGVRGLAKENPERPERIDLLISGAIDAGCEFVDPTDHGIGPLSRVHTPAYLHFLKTIHERWCDLEDASEEVRPNINPSSRSVGYPKSPVGLAGYHLGDTSCPVSEGTWAAAYFSAQSALSAAESVSNGDRAAYSLSRPPGHHASKDLAGGFCYLNNCAIVAEHLVSMGHRPAILDVDVHHGNGTQQIFYNRSDVLTISVHAETSAFYPFFWGYENERGEYDGQGYNLNIPLEKGAADTGYHRAVEHGLEAVSLFGSDILVVALGLDAFEGDPFQQLSVTTPGFHELGRLLAGINLPTILIQEGGYLTPELGENLRNVITGFESVS